MIDLAIIFRFWLSSSLLFPKPMLSNHTIAVIGAGNIGRALIGGLLKGAGSQPREIRATRRNGHALGELAGAFPSVVTGTDNVRAVEGATVVVLAVKPQIVREVIAEIRAAVPGDALIVSVLAGVTSEALEAAFGGNHAVVRTMPNTPMLVDEGATAIAPGTHASSEQVALVQQMFEAVGKVEVVPEYLLDAVTGLSGSGPAYIYMVIEALTDGGVKQGIPRPQALRLAAQTVFGAAKLVLDTGKHPAILKDEVTTPGGTAIAAISNLESHGLRTMLIDAVATATARSKELSRVS